MQTVKLSINGLNPIRSMDPRLVSYNIEMAEVTGGTFWKAYTLRQVLGSEPFRSIQNMEEIETLMQVYSPIDLSNAKLRFLARQLGPSWVRVSGTWATKTFYDFDGHTGGVPPEGYQAVLTRKQWEGVLDFVRTVGAKLLISVANCAGLHSAHEPWNPSQAKRIFDYSRTYGVPVDAVEFMNEPNALDASGAPAGYTAADYVRDQDLFVRFIRENYPDVLLVGPCGMCTEQLGDGHHLPASMHWCATDCLLDGAKESLDIYSYHYYNGVSDRLSAIGGYWGPNRAHTEQYLSVAEKVALENLPLRDKYCPGAPVWVTESADASGGGSIWASTFLDVFRTLNELGRFAQLTDGIIFHNTLAASDYGLLARESFAPRPNYFALLLWKRLMGSTVFEPAFTDENNVHIYTHSRADGQPGVACLMINNSPARSVFVEIPAEAWRYTLSAPSLWSPIMLLNGKTLILKGNQELPDLSPIGQQAGSVELLPFTCTFLVFDAIEDNSGGERRENW